MALVASSSSPDPECSISPKSHPGEHLLEVGEHLRRVGTALGHTAPGDHCGVEAVRECHDQLVADNMDLGAYNLTERPQ